MANNISDLNSLTSKLPKNLTISASCKINDILRLKVKSIPEAEILRSFKAAIDRASNRITIELKQALDNAMKSSIWPTVSGAADIYDTGELMESGSVKITNNGVIISYDAPYAALVHYGGYINPYGNNTEKIYLPARPWVDAVLNGGNGIAEFDFARYYQEEIEKEFS